MTMTVKFCNKCAGGLSLLRPSTEDEIQFFLTDKRAHRPLNPKGTCDKCGQMDNPTYYQFPG